MKQVVRPGMHDDLTEGPYRSQTATQGKHSNDGIVCPKSCSLRLFDLQSQLN